MRVEDYVPGLDYLQRLTRTGRGGAIKLSPAANFGGKFRDVEVELVSLHGECKEATIWFGELRGTASWRATILPTGETITGEPLDFTANISAPLQYVFDPDPAVVRAGLVDAVAVQLGLNRLDPAEEYLTGTGKPCANRIRAGLRSAGGALEQSRGDPQIFPIVGFLGRWKSNAGTYRSTPKPSAAACR